MSRITAEVASREQLGAWQLFEDIKDKKYKPGKVRIKKPKRPIRFRRWSLAIHTTVFRTYNTKRRAIINGYKVRKVHPLLCIVAPNGVRLQVDIFKR